MPSTPVAVHHIDVSTSRLRTHVLTAGRADAPVLVLVHGNVSSARFFAPAMTVLGARCRCLAPDLRGFGRSEAVPVDARRGVRDFADDLYALLTESHLVPEGQRVQVVGEVPDPAPGVCGNSLGAPEPAQVRGQAAASRAQDGHGRGEEPRGRDVAVHQHEHRRVGRPRREHMGAQA